MATSEAPFTVETVTLRVRDLSAVAAFYERIVGLRRLSSQGEEVTLGASARPLLRLWQDPHATRAAPGEAGLFHTAFLLPSRADLGAWLAHARDGGVRLTGAADHGVSEALYIDDPEGNGIEIYCDRPRTAWPRDGETIMLTNDPLDRDALAAAGGRWRGAPDGTVIGHVHLRTGALPEADDFWTGTMGLALTCRFAQASFYGGGGYHHHVAVNTWASEGAGRRPEGRLGLADMTFAAAPAVLAALGAEGGPLRLCDPSGLPLTVVPRPG